MRRIWKGKHVCRLVLCTAIWAGSAVAAYGQENSTYQIEWDDSEEEWEGLEWDSLSWKEKVVLVYDQSGSAREQEEIVHDIKLIFYELLYGNAHIDCTVVGFDDTCSFRDGRDAILKITGKETDILNAVKSVDYYIRAGKQPVSLIMVSDYYDTSNGMKKLLLESDKKTAEERAGKIQALFKGWKELEELKQGCFYYWDALKEKQEGYFGQAGFLESNYADETRHIEADENGEWGEIKKRCVKDAISLITGNRNLDWISYAEIPVEEEALYHEYYLYTEHRINEPERLDEKQVFERIAGKCRTAGFIYHVKNISFGELGLNQSLYAADVLQVPPIDVSVEIDQILGDDKAVYPKLLTSFSMSFQSCEERVEEPGAALILDITMRGSDNIGDKGLSLKYQDAKRSYEGEFIIPKAGEYDLSVYQKIDGDRRDIWKAGLVIKNKDVFFKNADPFIEKVKMLGKGTGSQYFELRDYFSNYKELTFDFETGRDLNAVYDKKSGELILENEKESGVDDYVRMDVRYTKPEYGGKGISVKIYTK